MVFPDGYPTAQKPDSEFAAIEDSIFVASAK